LLKSISMDAIFQSIFLSKFINYYSKWTQTETVGEVYPSQ
jgi:hypothetical protein